MEKEIPEVDITPCLTHDLFIIKILDFIPDFTWENFLKNMEEYIFLLRSWIISYYSKEIKKSFQRENTVFILISFYLPYGSNFKFFSFLLDLLAPRMNICKFEFIDEIEKCFILQRADLVHDQLDPKYVSNIVLKLRNILNLVTQESLNNNKRKILLDPNNNNNILENSNAKPKTKQPAWGGSVKKANFGKNAPSIDKKYI